MVRVRGYDELRSVQTQRDRGLRNKVMSLEEAANLIQDGQSVGIGGSMMSRTPMAMIWQLIRSERKNLICSRSITTSEGDLLLGSGLSNHVITSWFSQGIMWGISKVMRTHIESGRAVFEEWSHLAMGMRFRAGAMGLPCMPIRSMLGSDILSTGADASELVCPFTQERLLLVPALNPDVAIIHVHACDEYGNARIDGLPFMDIDLALAADKVILTTEKIIPNRKIREAPDQTKIPFFAVDAVVEVPFGSAPHECYGIYEPMMTHLDAYAKLVNSSPVKGFDEYLRKHYLEPASWNEFLSLIGLEEILEAAKRGRTDRNV